MTSLIKMAMANLPNIVRLPFNPDLPDPDLDIDWGTKVSALTELSAMCELCFQKGLHAAELQHGNHRHWLKNTISVYNNSTRADCNFDVIQKDDKLCGLLIETLPIIIDNALRFPERLANPIHVLRNGENEVIYLKRSLVCSIIANGFLSTFPNQRSMWRTYVNFWRLFHEDKGKDKFESRSAVKREKIKCILEYFRQMGRDTVIPDTVISYKRFHYAVPIDWENETEHLSVLWLNSESRIEEAEGFLQVDFANQEVGGGVLHDGALQEEIRFCINPELLAARLFTDRLGCDDVLLVTGTRQFSSYTGYGSTFAFNKLNKNVINLPVDDKGRESTQIVAMDAVNFHCNKGDQYEKRYIDRELHKSFIAFVPGRNLTPVATGNWGCGAYNGDPQLKFLIQWMSASRNKRPVLYHANDKAQQNELQEMATFLGGKNVTVGELYLLLLKFEKVGLIRIFGKTVRKISVFDHIRRSLNQ